MWETNIASLEPPDCVADPVTVVFADPPLSEWAPITNLFLKSGVLFEPLHNTQPDGILDTVPDHNPINPDGIPVDPAFPCAPAFPWAPWAPLSY